MPGAAPAAEFVIRRCTVSLRTIAVTAVPSLSDDVSTAGMSRHRFDLTNQAVNDVRGPDVREPDVMDAEPRRLWFDR